MKAILVIALATALFVYGAPASADVLDPEGPRFETSGPEYVPALPAAPITIVAPANLDENQSRVDAR